MFSPRVLLAVGLIFVLLAACGGDTDEDGGSALTATPTAASPTATTVVATPPPDASPTSEPTAEPTMGGPESVQYEHVASWGEPVIPQMPVDVHVTADGSLYVADSGRREVQIFDPDGELVARWTPPVADAGTEFERTGIPILISGDQSGNVYTFDAVAGRLSKFDSEGTPLAEHPFEDSDARMCDMTVAASGRIYAVVGQGCDVSMPFPPTGVYVFDEDLNQLAFWEGPEDVAPAAISFDAAGTAHLLVGTWVDSENLQSLRIVTIDPANYDPANWTENVTAVEPQADFDGILAGPEGRLFLIHENDGGHPVEPATTFYEIDEAGALVTSWEIEDQHHGVFRNAPGVDVSPDGLIYLADPSNARVMRLSLDGEPQGSFSAVEPGRFGFPFGITVGPDGNVYVADDSLERVQVFEPDGTFVEERHYGVGLQGISAQRNDLAVASDGTVHYVSPSATLRWWLTLSPEGEETVIDVDKIMGDPREGSQFSFRPGSIALNSNGTVHLAMHQQPWVRSYTIEGEFLEHWPDDLLPDLQVSAVETGPNGAYALTLSPEGTAITPLGGDPLTDAIARFVYETNGGAEPGIVATAYDFAIDDGGNFFVLDQVSGDVIMLAPDGILLSRWSALDEGSDPAQMRALAVDDEGRVFVVDGAQRQVHVFAPAG